VLRVAELSSFLISSKKQTKQRPQSSQSLSLGSFLVERQNNKAELPLTILQNTSSITSVSETNSPNGLKMSKSTSSNYLSSISSYSKSTYSSTTNKHQQSGGSSISGSSRRSNNGKDTNGDLTACLSSDTSTSSLIYSMNDSFDVGSSNGVSNVGKLLPSLSLDDDDDEYNKSLNNMTNDIDKLVRDADKQLTNLNHNHEGNEKTYLSSSEEGSSEEGSDDDNEGRDTEAADLVANTLAECRLLLDMSPPPTPIGYQKEAQRVKEHKKKNVKTGKVANNNNEEVPPPMQSDKIKTVHHHYPKQQEQATMEDPPAHQPRRTSQEISDVSISKGTYTASSQQSMNNNSIQPSLSSIAKFLTCPTCNQEFSEEFENATPLHSFACDHIICRGCVFANGNQSTTAVACPDCGEANAFDTCRPVVSRAYLNLITKMKSVGSIKSSSVNNDDDDDDMKEERRVRIDNNNGRIGRHRGGGKVPTQISVPSPRVDRQAKETRGGEETASMGTSSVISNDFSKSSLTLSTTRRLHKPLPKLAIETGEQSAPSIPTLEAISSTPKVKETLATTDMSKEPITPVSRAEYRFLQRKEKLAQSLEKVNRILERSKANKQQVEDRVVQHSQEKVSVYQNMTLSQVQEDENRDAVDVVETNEEVVRDMVPGYHKVEVRRAPSGLEQQNQSSITGRRNVELRVDTGPKSSTALQARRRKKAEELDINAYPVQNDTVDIFRTTNYDDTAPQLIEFGTHFIGQTFSNGSSLTDMDTLFLLGGGKKSPATCTASVQSNNKFSSPFKKDRLNNIMKSSPMKSRGHLNSIMKSSRSSQSLSNMDNDDDQQEQEPDVCPQFLPSLTYATMDDECNEVAGLIAMSPHNKDYTDPPQPMWGVGSRSVASADQCGSVLTSMTGSSKVRGKRSGSGFLKHLTSRNDSMFPRPVVDVMQNNGNENNGMLQNNKKEQEAPTYDFVSHSCSMSPSSYCDGDNKQTSQLSGSGLVTHKPKILHKKLLNTFRRGGKKKTMR